MPNLKNVAQVLVFASLLLLAKASPVKAEYILEDSLPLVADDYGPSIYALAVTDDYLFIGGAFSWVESGEEMVEIAEFAKIDRTTHQVDTSCNLNISSEGMPLTVYTILAEGDDVFIGGSFVSVGGDETRDALVKIDAHTCAVDTNFNPTLDWTINYPSVYSLAKSGDDLYVGGLFTSIAGNSGAEYLAKISATTGLADESFTITANNAVFALELVGDYLYLGGAFTGLLDPNTEESLEINELARININTNDWDESCDLGVFTEEREWFTVNALENDGENIFVGGSFTSVGGDDNKAALFKFTHDSCTVLDEFEPLVSYPEVPTVAKILDLEYQDGYLYIGGFFSEVGSIPIWSLAKIASDDGAIDTNFNFSTLGGNVYALATIGQDFYWAGNFGYVTDEEDEAIERINIARLTLPSEPESPEEDSVVDETTDEEDDELDPEAPLRTFTINHQGKEYQKEFKALNLRNLEIARQTSHPQFCFTKGFDESGLSHYNLQVNSVDYLTNIPASQPPVGGDTRQDGGNAVIFENHEKWIRYESYDNPKNEQRVCVYGKGDQYRLKDGYHTWEVFAVDEAGHQTGVGKQHFLLGSNTGSLHPEKLWFPLMLLQVGNKVNLFSYSTINSKLYDQNDTIIISDRTPIFHGIAVTGTRVELKLERDEVQPDLSVIRTTSFSSSTDTNILSQWGINVIETLVKGNYYLTITASDVAGNRAALKDIPLQIL